MSERFNCTICTDFTSDSNDDYFVTTHCGHVFHYNCMKRLITRKLKQNKPPTCPLCRETISFETLTRLYGIEAPIEEDPHMRHPDLPCDHVFKIVLLGEAGVGKTTLTKRYAGHGFVETRSTVGYDMVFKFIRICNKKVRLNMWDTAGTEQHRAVIPSILRDAHAIFFVYSITDIRTFDRIPDWMEFAIDHGPENAVRILIGNKSDQENLRTVQIERGEEFSQTQGIRFFETSAVDDNVGVEAAFRTAVAEILEDPDLVENADNISINRRRVQPEFSEVNGNDNANNSNTDRCGC